MQRQPRHEVVRQASASERQHLAERAIPTADDQAALRRLPLDALRSGLLWFAFAWPLTFITRRLGKLAGVEASSLDVVTVIVIGLGLVVGVWRAVDYYKDLSAAMREDRDDAQADLASATVTEERYTLVAAKRFRDAKSGRTDVYLLTDDGSVLVVPERDSFEARERNAGDNLASSLTLVATSPSKAIISRQFSGAELVAAAPVDFSVDWLDRPECWEFCDIPWDQLEAKLSR